MRKLYRSRHNAIIGGVCAGVADYFDVDPTIVRLAWAVLIFLGGTGILAYVVAWLIIPVDPDGVYAEVPARPAAAPAPTSTRDLEPVQTDLGQPIPTAAAAEIAQAPAAVRTVVPQPPEPSVTFESVPPEAHASPKATRPAVTPDRDGGGPSVLGLLMIAAGALLLARNLLPWLQLERLWPLALIGLGLFLVVGALTGGRDRTR